jgi:dynein heavy chain
MEEANQETLILMKAIRDMNMPKFVAEDVPLFNALFNDLFPNMDLPESVNETLRDEIEA